MQAAIVVSDTKERLSPNIAPPTTVPTQSGREKPDVTEIAAAIGVRSVIVPTDVPIRLDHVSIRIISEETAILRHHFDLDFVGRELEDGGTEAGV